MRIPLIVLFILFISCKSQQNSVNIVNSIIEISQSESKSLNLPKSYLNFKEREKLLENVLSQFDCNVENKLLIKEVFDSPSIYYCTVFDVSSMKKTEFIFKYKEKQKEFSLLNKEMTPINTLADSYTNTDEGFEKFSEEELNYFNQSELQYINQIINNSSLDLYNDPINNSILNSKPVNVSLIQKDKLIWVKIFRE